VWARSIRLDPDGLVFLVFSRAIPAGNPPEVPFSGIANPSGSGLNIWRMSTVAEQLRAAREARDLSIAEVAEITKIRTDHIRALEEGNYDVFVAPVYIRGFVRTYATLLKLDVPGVVKSLAAELGQTEKHAEPPPLSKEGKSALDFVMLQLSKVNWRKGALVLGGLAVVAVVVCAAWLWRRQRNADPSAGLPPAVYQPAKRTSGDTLKLPPPEPRR
jgi:cytoskeletal protein RodZ